MVSAAKGFTFNDTGGAGNVCSAANLHALVDSATFSGLSIGDFISTERPVYVSGSSPGSPEIGQCWFSPQQNGAASNPVGFIFCWNGSEWVPVADGAYFTNKTGQQVTFGQVLQLDTANNNSFKAPTGAGRRDVIGVAGATIADNASGLVITHGFAAVAEISGTKNRWGWLQTHANGSFAATSSAGAPGAGAFGRLLDTTNLLVYLTGVVA